MSNLSRLTLVWTLLLIANTLIAQDLSSFKYRTVGPERGGRVTTVTGTASEPGTFYLGATGGGVWKTTDYGVSWNNVSDGFFETPSIGAIEIAHNDPNIVYVGTGSDGLRSNVISGRGMYKSVDGGKTWEHIGLKNVGQIGAVEIDPTNHNIVWVAAIGNAFRANPERGVYKTMDGGTTWEKVMFISEDVGFVDLELLPGNPEIVYAAAWKARRLPWSINSGGKNSEGGIYKSENGGKDWKRLKKGLPKGLIGKIDLAVSPVDSSILYAVIEAADGEHGLYRSKDQGASFEHVSDDERLVNRPFYYTNIELDPTDPNIVFSNANPLLKSTDGGKTWERMSVPHGDNHDIWLNPLNPDILIQCNDGGANVSHNGGKTWSSQFNQPTAELYQVEVDDQYPYWLYAGMQDNSSTIAVPSFPPSSTQTAGKGWIINTGGCETGPAVPKPGNHTIVYANCKGRFSVFNKTTGNEKGYYVGASNIYGHNPKDLEYRFQRVAPIHVSPHDPDVVYHGSQYLHKTTNDGLSWETISPDLTAFEPDKQVISGSPITRDITGEEYYSTVYSIRESKLTKGLIWVGSNDGLVHLTRDGGANWQNVTPKKLPKGGRVESVEPSHFDPAKAYVVVDRHLLGDTKPYLYKTSNYGASWELISEGIPADFSARVLREDPVRPGLLFAGTEYGIFVSFNDGATWTAFQQNLPVTPVTDMKIHRGDLVISTMGRGFWILDNISPLRQQEINALGNGAVLFEPNTTVRYRWPMSSWSTFPEYPDPAVIFDYFVPEGYKGSVQLEILDAQGNSVAIIESGADSKEDEEVVEDMNLSATFRFSDKSLESKPGLHRFSWNMRGKGAWHSNERRRFKNGPLVAPGTYKARLRLGEQTAEQMFEIIMDPRVMATGISESVIKEQVAFQNKVIELLSEARRLQSDLEEEAKDLEKMKGRSNKERLERVNMALSELKNAEGAYPQQMLVSQISYLFNMVSGADQEIGKDATSRLLNLSKQFDELKVSLGN